jgi:hypothetical protein
MEKILEVKKESIINSENAKARRDIYQLSLNMTLILLLASDFSQVCQYFENH